MVLGSGKLIVGSCGVSVVWQCSVLQQWVCGIVGVVVWWLWWCGVVARWCGDEKAVVV